MRPYLRNNLILRCELIVDSIKNSDGQAPQKIETLLNRLSTFESDEKLEFNNLFLENGLEKEIAKTLLSALLDSTDERAKALANEIKHHITPQPQPQNKVRPNRKIDKPLYAYQQFSIYTPAFPFISSAFTEDGPHIPLTRIKLPKLMPSPSFKEDNGGYIG